MAGDKPEGLPIVEDERAPLLSPGQVKRSK